MPYIKLGHLNSFPIPIYDLDIQLLITSELDAMQAMIDGYKAQIADLDALAQSIFLDMFGDPVTNPKGREIMKIGEISEVTSSKRIYQSEQTKSGIPFYKISDFPNLIEYGYSDTGIFISQAKYEELKSQKLVPNESDLLITSRGTLGLCYIVKDEDCFYFQDGMITWLKNLKSTVLSAFLGFMFQSSLFKNQIEKAQNGSTIAYLSIAMIRKFDMIVPPIKLQQHFVSQVEAIEKQKELIRDQLAETETLMATRQCAPSPFLPFILCNPRYLLNKHNAIPGSIDLNTQSRKKSNSPSFRIYKILRIDHRFYNSNIKIYNLTNR